MEKEFYPHPDCGNRFTQIRTGLAITRVRFLSSLAGLVPSGGATHRWKRWAVVGRPCRDFKRKKW